MNSSVQISGMVHGQMLAREGNAVQFEKQLTPRCATPANVPAANADGTSPESATQLTTVRIADPAVMGRYRINVFAGGLATGKRQTAIHLPVNTLFDKSKYVSWCSSVADVGILPDKPLLERSRDTSAEKVVIVALIVPFRSLLDRCSALHTHPHTYKQRRTQP